LAGTAVCLVLGVGALAVHRHPAVGGGTLRPLSRADSLIIDSAYDAEQALSASQYRPPDWIRAGQLARLREVARRELAGDTTVTGPRSDGSERWAPRADPIRVWVEPRAPAPGFDPSFVVPARAAFLTWTNADVGAAFALVDDSTDADVYVTWSNRVLTGRELGTTFRLTDRRGNIVSAHVILSTAVDVYAVQNAALHEAGHVLGLEHSSRVGDVMAAESNGRQDHLSDNDIARARLLYGQPP
jgi:hypothetical protein